MSAFIDAHRERFGVELICQTIGCSASAYYQRASGERSARTVEGERVLALIKRVHSDNYEAYGYRRLWKQLLREGERVPRCQVQRLMRPRDPGRQAPRAPVAHHPARRRGTDAAGPHAA